MSGPYDQYNQGGYGQPGYPPQAPQYGQPSPAPSYGQQSPYPPHGQQQSPYPPQQGGYASPPPQPTYGENPSGYGPPQHGGFQHGQMQPYQDPNAPQGQYGYPAEQQQQPPHQQYPGAQASEQFPQQGAYNQQPYPADPNNPNQAPYDPNAPEGERGIMGAMAGGAAGWYGGKKAGGHNIIGAVVGAFAGHKLEEAGKNKYQQHQQHNNGQGKW